MNPTLDRDPHDFEIEEGAHSLLPVRSSQLPTKAEDPVGSQEEVRANFSAALWRYLGHRRA